MQKRGQSTIFILIGLIIIILIIGIIYTQQALQKQTQQAELSKETTLPPKLEELKQHIQTCVEDTAPTGIFMLGLQGGYIIPPENSLETNYTTIAYAYKEGKSLLTSTTKMESELNTYMTLFIPLCIDFNKYPSLKITPSRLESRTKIDTDSLLISIRYPLKIKYDSTEAALDEVYSKTYPVRLGRLHFFASEIVKRELEDPDNIDMTYLLDTETNVNILPYDDKTIIYSLTDPGSKINDIEFTFMFANKFGR